MYIQQFTDPFPGLWNFGWFPVGGCYQQSCCVRSHTRLWGGMPSSSIRGMAGSNGGCPLEETITQFSEVVGPFFHPHQQHVGVPVPRGPCQRPAWSVSKLQPFSDTGMVFKMSGGGPPFHVSIWHPHIFCGETSFHIFCPFLKSGWSAFFCSEFWEFIEFWIQVSYQVYALQIFSFRLCSWSFLSLKSVFWGAELLNFEKIFNLSKFSFMGYTLMLNLKSIAYPKVTETLSYISPRNIALWSTFRSRMPFAFLAPHPRHTEVPRIRV